MPSATVKSLGIDQLPRDERLVLVQEIWDTITAEQPTLLLNQSQRKELERRIADDNENPDDVVPWDQVKADALGQIE